MSVVPSISASIQNAFTSGFARLDRAAAELTTMNDSPDPTTPGLPPVSTPSVGDPAIQGIFDLMMAKVQIGAGALLLHQYSDDRRQLWDLLRE